MLLPSSHIQYPISIFLIPRIRRNYFAHDMHNQICLACIFQNYSSIYNIEQPPCILENMWDSIFKYYTLMTGISISSGRSPLCSPSMEYFSWFSGKWYISLFFDIAIMPGRLFATSSLTWPRRPL